MAVIIAYETGVGLTEDAAWELLVFMADLENRLALFENLTTAKYKGRLTIGLCFFWDNCWTKPAEPSRPEKLLAAGQSALHRFLGRKIDLNLPEELQWQLLLRLADPRQRRLVLQELTYKGYEGVFKVKVIFWPKLRRPQVLQTLLAR